TLALLQLDVRGDRFRAEFADDVDEAVGGGIDVGIVDLIRVAGENDFRAVANAGDDGFHFERREVLGLVDDHELVGDAAAADVTERLHNNCAGTHQVAAAAVVL